MLNPLDGLALEWIVQAQVLFDQSLWFRGCCGLSAAMCLWHLGDALDELSDE